MILGFATAYVWLSYYTDTRCRWSLKFKIVSIGGFIALAVLALLVEQTALLLPFIAASVALHFYGDLWNPFHSGIVAASVPAVAMVIAVSNPIMPIGSGFLSHYVGAVIILSGGLMAVTVLVTSRTGNPVESRRFRDQSREKHQSEMERETSSPKGDNVDHTLTPGDSNNGESDKPSLSEEKREELAEIYEKKTDPINPFKWGDDRESETKPRPNAEVAEHDGDKNKPRNSMSQSQNTPPIPKESRERTEDEDQVHEFDKQLGGTKDQNSTNQTHGDFNENGQSLTTKERLLQQCPKLEMLEFPWEEPPDTRFENIGGYPDVKERLTKKIIKPLQDDSEIYDRFKIDPPRGVLFHGPPGTGKTLFARGLANALNRPFVELTQAHLTHAHINESPRMIQRVFVEAQELGGIIFIDEAEQLLIERGDLDNSHSEDSKVTNTFLSNLTRDEKDFILLLTTNRMEMIDEAMLRPGRIDSQIEIGLPDAEARKEILKVKMADVPCDITSSQAESVAHSLDDWSGADIEGLVTHAKYAAVDRQGNKINFEDLKAGYTAINKSD